jgi:putative ABC transport system permease protein
MTTPWHKALRDFWQESTRSILVVLAMAVGIAGFAAVLASYAILTRELNRGYMATNPASAALRTDAIDDELLAAIRAGGGVSAVEARRTLSGRIRVTRATANNPWRNLRLFVVKDFAAMRVSTINREHGAWPPAAGEILIERDAFQVAQARIGDRVTVKTLSGKETPLQITGSVHDVGQAQARMDRVVYGYVTLDTLALMGEDPVLNQIEIIAAGDRFNETHVREVAAAVKGIVESRGHPVLRMDVPKPGKHPHADIMGLLLLIMSSFGLFVLLLSGIIVINLLTALMASQIRQIGVMKTVGGTRGQIARIYLGQALMLGAAAVILALPVGIWGSRVLCRYQAVFLNFDITSFAIPAWVFLLVAVVGLLVPLLAAAIPVWKGSGVSVRKALDDFGVSRNTFGATGFDRLVTRLGGAARPLLLAIRNNFRRRMRLALTLVTLATGGLFFMAALNVRASMMNTLDRLFGSRKFDLSVSLAGMASWDDVQQAVAKTPGIVRAEGWIGTEAALALLGPGSRVPVPAGSSRHPEPGTRNPIHGGEGVEGDKFIILAIPPQTAFLKFDLIAGRDLLPADTDTVVINSALATKFPAMKVGSKVPLRMGPGEVVVQVVGITREPFSPPLAYLTRRFFDLRGGHDGTANQIRLVLQKTDPASIDAVKASLEQNLVAAGMRPANISSKGESRFGFDQHMVMIYVFLIVMACMLAGVGGLGLMTTMSLNVLERRREMGVMRAIGATPAALSLILVAEGCLIGVLSWAMAAVAAWPVSRGVGDLLLTVMFKTSLDFTFDGRGVVIWLALSIVLGAVASIVPAWQASRQPLREALGYE